MSVARRIRNIESVLVVSFFLLSGACSLIYETIWLRELKLVFGNTTVAASVTVALFMAGLATGAIVLHSRLDALKHKLRLYAYLELGIAISALLTIPLLAGADAAYIHFYRHFAPSTGALLGVQILLSSLVMAAPTCLMGLTLPLLSAWTARQAHTIGARFGVLYASNTLGAVLGAFGAGFFFIETLGVRGTLYLAASINLCVGVTALALSERIERVVHPIPSRPFASTFSQPSRLRVDSTLFVSGLVAMGYEIVWIRTSVPYLRATTYTFSAILCVYLLGYAGGVFSGSALLRKTERPQAWSDWLMQALGLCGVLYMAGLVGISRFLSVSLSEWTNHLLFDIGRYFTLFYAGILFFVPSFFMGLNVPLLIHLRARERADGGRIVAGGYFINTVGGVVGPLLTGFCLIPYLGSQHAIQALGLLAMASVALWVNPQKNTKNRAAMLSAFAAAIAFVAFGPKNDYLDWLNRIEGKDEPTELVDALEGVTTTASVHRYVAKNFRVITTAGINVAGDHIALRQTQKAQGHIPIILHGNPRKVLTVGFGSGELTKLLTLHQIPDITCVELSPEVVTLSKRYFAHINLGTNLEQRVKMVYMDAKNYIHVTDQRFDVILNDAIWPGLFADNSSLYTREYFLDGKSILSDDGIYSTWLPLSLSEESLKSILRTFSDVFENAILVYPHYTPSQHALLIGQKKSHPYAYTSMATQLENKDIRDSLQMIGIESADDILESIFAGNASIKEWALDAATNSDAFPVVEFDHNLYRSGFNAFLAWDNLYRMMLVMRPADIDGLVVFPSRDIHDRVMAAIETRQKAVGHLLMSFMYLDREKDRRAVEAGLAIDPTNVSLLHRRDTLADETTTP